MTTTVQLTWREIRDHVINACRQKPEALAEFYHLASAGLRELCAGLDISELYVEGETAIVALGDDRIPKPTNLQAIDWIYNQTESQRVEPEEDGRHGRSKYIDTAGKPPPGSIYRYVKTDRWILLRDTANQETTLILAYKIHPPDVTKAQLDQNPVTEPQYDWALVYLIAAHFYALHPITGREAQQIAEAGGQIPTERGYRDSARNQLLGIKRPAAIESRDDRSKLITPGYGVGGFNR